ncbi:MAG: hypothetical protein KF729_02740 [Sandaracinaceae bacterium]|nr:hypothetical protein [Sandaracinaceae bacterium]
MRAVLLVDHGSRSAAANRVVEDVACALRERYGAYVAVAHMELAPPTVAEAVATCVAAGATHVVAVPYFLGPGRHTTRDLPRLVGEAVAGHPGLTYELADPFGADARIVALVAARAGLDEA